MPRVTWVGFESGSFSEMYSTESPDVDGPLHPGVDNVGTSGATSEAVSGATADASAGASIAASEAASGTTADATADASGCGAVREDEEHAHVAARPISKAGERRMMSSAASKQTLSRGKRTRNGTLPGNALGTFCSAVPGDECKSCGPVSD